MCQRPCNFAHKYNSISISAKFTFLSIIFEMKNQIFTTKNHIEFNHYDQTSCDTFEALTNEIYMQYRSSKQNCEAKHNIKFASLSFTRFVHLLIKQFHFIHLSHRFLFIFFFSSLTNTRMTLWGVITIVP